MSEENLSLPKDGGPSWRMCEGSPKAPAARPRGLFVTGEGYHRGMAPPLQRSPHSSLDYLTPNEFVAQAARPAPSNATGRGAAADGASAPRPVAEPSPRGQLQRTRDAISH